MALTLPGIAKLRNAALVLRETTGYAYLPIIVPHEEAGRDALIELQRASAVPDDQWHETAWPQAAASTELPPEPPTAEARAEEQRKALEVQRKALLQSFDTQLVQDAHAGHTLVLDASPSTRHALAAEVVTYLNQRREQLRQHQRRLIVVWPAALSDLLLGGAPDLWSQRALSVVLAGEDAVVTAISNAIREAGPILPSRATLTRTNPVIEAQLAQWFAKHDLRRANLSGADALTLAEVLHDRYDFVESQLLAEAFEQAYPEDDGLRAKGKHWHSLALHGQGERARALESAVEAVYIFRRLARSNPAAYEPNLAASLSNLASFQSETGDRAGALTTALEAVEIRRRLARTNPAAYEPDLARSLSIAAIAQAGEGDAIAARQSAKEAVTLLVPWAQKMPDAFGPLLDSAQDLLANLSNKT